MQAVRQHLLAMLDGGQAFDTFDDILDEVPTAHRYTKPETYDHSAWEVLEHLRYALQDIVEFTDNALGTYVEKDWPQDYWPTEKPAENAWEESRVGYVTEMEKLKELVRTGDLMHPFPWGDGQTLLREALLAADHAAYHLGEIVVITRTLKSD